MWGSFPPYHYCLWYAIIIIKGKWRSIARRSTSSFPLSNVPLLTKLSLSHFHSHPKHTYRHRTTIIVSLACGSLLLQQRRLLNSIHYNCIPWEQQEGDDGRRRRRRRRRERQGMQSCNKSCKKLTKNSATTRSTWPPWCQKKTFTCSSNNSPCFLFHKLVPPIYKYGGKNPFVYREIIKRKNKWLISSSKNDSTQSSHIHPQKARRFPLILQHHCQTLAIWMPWGILMLFSIQSTNKSHHTTWKKWDPYGSE